MRKGIILVLSVIVLVGFSMAGQAGAATSTFDFDVTFSGATPGGTTPYLTATINDVYDGGKKVEMTISASGLDTMESITKLYFNFYEVIESGPNAGISDASLLTFKWNDSSAIDTTKANNAMQGGNDSFKADGDGWYDFWIDLPPPGGTFADRLTAGESIAIEIGYVDDITVNSFNYFSVEGGGNGSFLAAAHIQNIGDNGMSNEGSGWVGVVPEPVSSALFIVGAATLGIRGYRRRNK